MRNALVQCWCGMRVSRSNEADHARGHAIGDDGLDKGYTGRSGDVWRSPPSVQVEAWNAANPRGTRVSVKKDDGKLYETRTRSEAWLLGGHTAVVLVEGISGAYLLSRCKPMRERVETT